MSSEIERLELQLRQTFEGEAWHGPSVLELLQDVTPESAYAHPIAGAHSIWELVLHLAGTYKLVLRRMQGSESPLTPDEDWPSAPSPTPLNWQDTIGSLRQLSGEVRRAVLGFSPERLDRPLVAKPAYTAYTQFIGITQHDTYHGGQIALLKKALHAQANDDIVETGGIMAVKPIPEGYHSVTPYLIVKGAAAALDFYKKAFGAKELFRFPMPDGQIGHAEMKIGDSHIMLADEPHDPAHLQMGFKAPKSLGGTAVGIMLYVEDVDAIAKQAIAAGAKEVRPVVDQFYGDRSGTFLDPFGHVWTIGTHKEDVSSEEMQRRASQQAH